MHRPLHKDACGLGTPGLPALQPIQASLERVRSVILAELADEMRLDPVRPLVDHVFGSRGKMIRPGLLLACGQIVGSLNEQHIQAAAIMEMIHQATLLHDDVLDCAETRRGAASANHVWGNSAAVLLGDLVLSRVLRRCADLRMDVSRVVADMACRVCRGELRQTLQRTHWHITEREYLEIIADKSASFFDACCQVGAILAEASPEQRAALGEYGFNVGMAFQVADDVLDVTADPEKAGKSTGRDAGLGTPTLPMIHLLCTMDPADRDALIDCLRSGDNVSDTLADLMTRHGSLEYARATCRDYVDRALQSLDKVGSTDAHALVALARYSVARAG